MKRLLHRAVHRLRPAPPPQDMRSRRVVAVIECMVNQNVRDAGAATSPAMAWEVLSLCQAHGVGLLPMTCPEMACLGWARTRPPGSTIREALDTAAGRQACAELAAAVVDRIQALQREGVAVLAVLGGNGQSPGCAVHDDAGTLAPSSGLFMQALQAELRRRGQDMPFRGMRDADAALLAEDLVWLRERLATPPVTVP